MSAKTAWETVKNSACYFSLFLYVHLKAVFFLIWNTALQEKWKSIYMHYFRSSYTERFSDVAHSNFGSLHFFIFFLSLAYQLTCKNFQAKLSQSILLLFYKELLEGFYCFKTFLFHKDFWVLSPYENYWWRTIYIWNL